MVVKHCDLLQDVLFLGVRHINTPYDLYAAVMPFFNEIANLVTITITKPLLGVTVYAHHPKTEFELNMKTFIDMLAITGIIANATSYSVKYSKMTGFVKGSLYAIFTFMIPSLILSPLLKLHSSLFVKFIIGVLFIYMLDLSVHLLTCIQIDRYIANKINED